MPRWRFLPTWNATRRLLRQQLEITDQEIDRLVYVLYGLAEEEIANVEGAST